MSYFKFKEPGRLFRDLLNLRRTKRSEGRVTTNGGEDTRWVFFDG